MKLRLGFQSVMNDVDFRNSQFIADCYPLDIPAGDKGISKILSDAQHLLNIFDADNIRIFREHNAI